MIPESYIESWRAHVPWQTLAMVEQGMVISRALINLYNHPKIQDSLIFRGGTALNKLIIVPPSRYSEDIDFVQIKQEPIGETIDVIRDVLDPWLGDPKRKLTQRSAKLVYKVETRKCLTPVYFRVKFLVVSGDIYVGTAFGARRGENLEFKENAHSLNGIVKTVIAFANTAGGVIVIGVKNRTKEVIGLVDLLFEELHQTAELIRNNL